MLYLSEKTKKTYKTVEELKEAEKQFDKAQAAKEKEKETLKADAAKIEDAFNELAAYKTEAAKHIAQLKENYTKLIDEFTKKHEAYHLTIRDGKAYFSAFEPSDGLSDEWIKLLMRLF